MRSYFRYFLVVSYHGARYHGWQKQVNAVGVQNVIEDTISQLLNTPTNISGSGRTDTGVHALKQYAHFDKDEPIDIRQLTHQLNALLPPDIAVLDILEVRNEAHARFDAVSRSYHYSIHQIKNPFVNDKSYFFTPAMDIQLMNNVAALVADGKERDYACFSKSGGGQFSSLCQITNAKWVIEDSTFLFHISANRFLRNMVRALVGTMIEVGTSRISQSEFVKILESKDRSRAGKSVPAHGLFLSDVAYPADIFLPHE